MSCFRLRLRNFGTAMKNLTRQRQYASCTWFDYQTVVANLPPSSRVSSLAQIICQRRVIGVAQFCCVMNNQNRLVALVHFIVDALTRRLKGRFVGHFVATTSQPQRRYNAFISIGD